MDAKQFILEKIEPLIRENAQLSVLDLGCGQSRNFLPLLKKYPLLQYVGIEINMREAAVAQQLVKDFKNARVYNQPAYTLPAGYRDFDVCVSLSVIEHIKHWRLFLQNSVTYTKPGGHILHLYDLGHALFPKTLKERLHVLLGNYCPALLPEQRFVRYVAEQEVRRVLCESGATITEVSYHQMPDHKTFLKLFKGEGTEPDALRRQILEWEFNVSKFLHELHPEQRERLFPSVCVWAVRR
jgi:SAM-dependent methyltransferase